MILTFKEHQDSQLTELSYFHFTIILFKTWTQLRNGDNLEVKNRMLSRIFLRVCFETFLEIQDSISAFDTIHRYSPKKNYSSMYIIFEFNLMGTEKIDQIICFVSIFSIFLMAQTKAYKIKKWYNLVCQNPKK